MGGPGAPRGDHAKLEERGIDFDQLREASDQPEADAFDLLCHLAFNGPLRTRRERADRVRKEERDFFDKPTPSGEVLSRSDEIAEIQPDESYKEITVHMMGNGYE